jgi:hypothetical protein
MQLELFFSVIANVLQGYILSSKKIAPFAKYALKTRDYLNLFFPEHLYPKGAGLNEDVKAQIESIGAEKIAVPVSEVKKAGKEYKFNIPFIKGM